MHPPGIAQLKLQRLRPERPSAFILLSRKGKGFCSCTNQPETIMKATYKRAAPYADDAMNLPVADVDAAIPFYETTFGFSLVSRSDAPFKSVVLERDDVQIGLAENGGDPTQEGCFFEVDDIESAFAEIKGKPATDYVFSVDKFGDTSMRVFFEVAPDGLCYMMGERL